LLWVGLVEIRLSYILEANEKIKIDRTKTILVEDISDLLVAKDGFSMREASCRHLIVAPN
jgi:hypothetical protein